MPCAPKPIKSSLLGPRTCWRPGPGVFKGDAVRMAVLKGAYEKREREHGRGGVVFQSSAVLSSHPSALTCHRCMLLSLNSQLLLDAISVHLKFSSRPLSFPPAHTAVSL